MCGFKSMLEVMDIVDYRWILFETAVTTVEPDLCCCCVPILLTTFPPPGPQRNVSIAAIRGAVRPSIYKICRFILVIHI